MRHAADEEVSLCEFSFAVSVRLMLLQLASEGLTVRTPELSVRGDVKCPLTGSYQQFEVQVAKKSLVVLEQPEIESKFAGTSVDILAWFIHEDSASRGNLAKQVGQSSEKRGPPRAEEDRPRCDARFSSGVE